MTASGRESRVVAEAREDLVTAALELDAAEEEVDFLQRSLREAKDRVAWARLNHSAAAAVYKKARSGDARTK